MTKRTKNILRRSVLVILGVILGVNVYLLNAKTVAQNALPMPFGVGCAVVQSGSMEPNLYKGDLLFVQQKDAYDVGDVVVYQAQNELIVHRIVATQGSIVVTQGDANNMSDAPFDASAIKGVVVLSIPVVGYVIDFFKTPLGIVLLLVVAILLVELSFRKEKRIGAHDERALRMKRMQEEIAQLKQDLNQDLN